eukprot:356011-Chlamydomonas_euryale.AAC.1
MPLLPDALRVGPGGTRVLEVYIRRKAADRGGGSGRSGSRGGSSGGDMELAESLEHCAVSLRQPRQTALLAGPPAPPAPSAAAAGAASVGLAPAGGERRSVRQLPRAGVDAAGPSGAVASASPSSERTGGGGKYGAAPFTLVRLRVNVRADGSAIISPAPPLPPRSFASPASPHDPPAPPLSLPPTRSQFSEWEAAEAEATMAALRRTASTGGGDGSVDAPAVEPDEVIFSSQTPDEDLHVGALRVGPSVDPRGVDAASSAARSGAFDSDDSDDDGGHGGRFADGSAASIFPPASTGPQAHGRLDGEPGGSFDGAPGGSMLGGGALRGGLGMVGCVREPAHVELLDRDTLIVTVPRGHDAPAAGASSGDEAARRAAKAAARAARRRAALIASRAAAAAASAPGLGADEQLPGAAAATVATATVGGSGQPTSALTPAHIVSSFDVVVEVVTPVTQPSPTAGVQQPAGAQQSVGPQQRDGGSGSGGAGALAVAVERIAARMEAAAGGGPATASAPRDTIAAVLRRLAERVAYRGSGTTSSSGGAAASVPTADASVLVTLQRRGAGALPAAAAALRRAATGASADALAGPSAAAAGAAPGAIASATGGEVTVRYQRIGTCAADGGGGGGGGDPLTGLYVGSFGPHGPELLRLSRSVSKNGSEVVTAVKLTGDAHVPAGSVSFRANIGRGDRLTPKDAYPHELGIEARYKVRE